LASDCGGLFVLLASYVDFDCVGEVADVIKLVLALFISLLAFCYDERIIPPIILVIVLQMYWGCGE
jgi:hypothetical protein